MFGLSKIEVTMLVELIPVVGTLVWFMVEDNKNSTRAEAAGISCIILFVTLFITFLVATLHLL